MKESKRAFQDNQRKILRVGFQEIIQKIQENCKLATCCSKCDLFQRKVKEIMPPRNEFTEGEMEVFML